jgi:hypothetical protein
MARSSVTVSPTHNDAFRRGDVIRVTLTDGTVQYLRVASVQGTTVTFRTPRRQHLRGWVRYQWRRVRGAYWKLRDWLDEPFPQRWDL